MQLFCCAVFLDLLKMISHFPLANPWGFWDSSYGGLLKSMMLLHVADTPQAHLSFRRHLELPNHTQGLQRITVLQSLAGISEEKVEALEPQDWSPHFVSCEMVH